MRDEILNHTLYDNSKLFKQAMEEMNARLEAEERLEEAEKLLKEWQALVQDVRQLGVESCIKKTELDKRTERFLEGKKE